MSAPSRSGKQKEWGVRGLPGVIDLDTTYLDTEQAIERVVSLWRERAIVRN